MPADKDNYTARGSLICGLLTDAFGVKHYILSNIKLLVNNTFKRLGIIKMDGALFEVLPYNLSQRVRNL